MSAERAGLRDAARRGLLAAAMALGLSAASLAAATPALAQAPRVIVAEALGLVRAKQAQAAYAKLKPLEPRFAGDPEFDYVLGLAALDSGKPGEAVRILSRVVESRPELLPPRAELGRALLTLGDLPAARQVFAGLVGDQRLPPQVRDVLGRYVLDIDRVLAARLAQGGVVAPGTTRVGGFVEVRAGYDSNINSATRDTEILIPFFAALGPALISPAGRARGDWFGEATLGLSIVHALAATDVIYANIVGSGKLYPGEGDFDTAIIGGELGYARDLGPMGRVSIALIGQSYMLDYTSYRDALGAAGLWTRTSPEGFVTTAYATYLFLDYDGDAKRNAHRFVAGGTLGQRFADLGGLYLYALAQAGTEQTTSTLTDHFSYTLAGVRAGAEMPVAPNVSLFANAGVEWRDYEAPFPLFFVERFDREFSAGVGFDWRFGDNMRLRPVLSYIRTLSNVALFEQTRWIASVVLRKEF